MASVDVLSGDSQMEDVPVWIYKPSAESDESILNAAALVSSDPQKYLLQDDPKTFKVKCISGNDDDNDNDDDTIEEEGELFFDFKSLKLSIKSESTPVKYFQLFYIRILQYNPTDSAKHRITLLYEEDLKLKLFHLSVEDDLRSVLILNAFRRSLFAFYEQFTSDVDDVVKVVNQCVPLYFDVVVVSVKDHYDQVVLNSGEYTVVIGAFFMSVFKKRTSCHPLYTVYFWQTQDTMVVNNIVLINDTDLIRIQSPEVAIEIPKASAQYPELLQAIKSMRPKPKREFIAPDKYVSYVSQRGKPVRGPMPSPSIMPKTETSWESYRGTDLHAETRQPIKTFRDTDLHTETRQRIKTFRDDMYVALRKFEDNEQIQLPWVMAETELKGLIDAGYVPETDIASGGLDPNSMDHFLQCVREIEEHLTTQNYDLALSRLKGTRLIYSESDVKEMRDLFRDGDITLVKLIYYHSFL